MTDKPAVDVSRQNVERIAVLCESWDANVGRKTRMEIPAILRALRDALDAAEKERDDLQCTADSLRQGEGKAIARAEAAESALAAERERSQWRPIESAPDREPCDLWGVHQLGHSMRFTDMRWNGADLWVDNLGRTVAGAGVIKFTHWRPLPEPPEV